MRVNLGKIDLTTDLIDIKNKKINLKEINLDNPIFAIKNYTGKRPEANDTITKPKDIFICVRLCFQFLKQIGEVLIFLHDR